MKYISFLLISLSLFSNCSSSKTSTAKEKTTQTASEVSGTYLVQNLYGEDVSEHKITMIFDPTTKSLSGFSGCNTYSCTYTTDGGKFSSGFPMATKMYCEKSGKLEKQFFKALSEMTNNEVKETILGCKNLQGEEIIIANKSN